jgi:flavin reductase
MSSDGPAPTIDAARYRSGMTQLAAAVNLVTSDGPAGLAGFTASAVTSVTDDPATLLVCAKRLGAATPRVVANGVLCVNVLAAEHRDLSARFGSSTHGGEDRFGDAGWRRLVTGSPVLDGAVAAFDCRITRVIEVGTHEVLFCEVVDLVESSDRTPLIYFRRGYRVIE